jgi:hypothetical protein
MYTVDGFGFTQNHDNREALQNWSRGREGERRVQCLLQHAAMVKALLYLQQKQKSEL